MYRSGKNVAKHLTVSYVGNPDNACYCLRDQGFSCFKSGVLNMAPCKRAPDMEMGAPIALSFPHFYQADPSFREAVGGLNPK